jgi:thiamine kinase-like enzyme
MAALYAEGDALTLVHTDINPSNVLMLDGVPYFIDWEAAHYGPFYLDVPHHFFTPALAEYYREALAEQGIEVPRARFAERFRIAARYTALRYMWWTFDAWRGDHSADVWVRHYFAMI